MPQYYLKNMSSPDDKSHVPQCNEWKEGERLFLVVVLLLAVAITPQQ